MSTFDEIKHDRDSAGKFTEMAGSEQPDTLGAVFPHAHETPVEIDEQLADLYDRLWAAREQADRRRSEISRYQGYLEREGNFPHRIAEYERIIERNTDEAEGFDQEAADLVTQTRPLDTEYDRRGRWPRAFLATSTNGHVHSSMDCSTCNKMGKMTRFAWMTDYSGAAESEIVDAAGERACTTCYPSAPVDILSRPTKMFSADEIAAAEARAARDAEKARKAAEREAKSITMPDGSPLREDRRYGHEARTLVTAERELTGALAYVIRGQSNTGAVMNSDFTSEQSAWANKLITAIAAKKGLTEDEVREGARVKAAKKLKSWGY